MPVLIPTRISLKNILVATDFSACSDAVLPYACGIARTYNSTLFLAHVISPDILGVDPFQMDAVRGNALRLMDDLKESDALKGLPHKTLVEEGETWDVLSRMVADNHIDLVVLGTHGRAGFSKFVMGSVAEDIFRHASCPVMTIGPKVVATLRQEISFVHVLYATDFASESPTAMHYAISLAEEHKAHLTLMHVAEADSKLPLPQRLLQSIPADNQLSTSPEAVIEIGEPAEQILRVAAQRHADLIVLGAHRPAILTTHLMDTAYRVVCEAPCPVLTVGASCHT
jgi:nucleotide-binding universal stress UspA family protein